MCDRKRYNFIKIASVIMAVVMFFVILFSVFFIVSEIGHDCEGEDCPICACIEQCEILINQCGTLAVVLCASIIPSILLYSFVRSIPGDIIFMTPVSQKIRLNN